jgi:hypothetical protein
MLARERLVHHAVDRLAAAGQRDQRAPRRQAADEGFGAVDRVEHPDIFGVRTLDAQLFADDAMRRKGLLDERAHRHFGGTVGSGNRIETAGDALVLDAKRGPKERRDRLTGDACQSINECGEVDGRHGFRVAKLGDIGNSAGLEKHRRRCGRQNTSVC